MEDVEIIPSMENLRNNITINIFINIIPTMSLVLYVEKTLLKVML